MTTLTRHLKAPADQPPRKPLYLMGTAAARMDAGADHLILHKGAGSLMRFPLARVCRVICTRHLTWSGAALALCLGRGVPITWVDSHGHALGTTQSHYDQPLPFATLIETYLELPDYAHLDTMIGRNAADEVFPAIVAHLDASVA